jgi:glycerophosphoryl diester phosphodiesterase
MPEYKTNISFVSNLKEKGILTFVHTINDIDKIKDYIEIGVHGFYTDIINYNNIEGL